MKLEVSIARFRVGCDNIYSKSNSELKCFAYCSMNCLIAGNYQLFNWIVDGNWGELECNELEFHGVCWAVRYELPVNENEFPIPTKHSPQPTLMHENNILITVNRVEIP